MHDDVRAAMRTAMTDAGNALQSFVGQFSEQFIVWKREGTGWTGHTEYRPCLTMIFAKANAPVEKAGIAFSRKLSEIHPEYAGMMGFRSLGLMNLGHQTSFILNQAMGALWKRHGTFLPTEPDVDSFIDEFATFIDQPTTTFRFSAELLNFNMDADELSLPQNLRIRRMTDEEVSEIHGGSLWQRGITAQRRFGMNEFTIEGEYEEPKAFGELSADFSTSHEDVRRKFDRAIMALRTFKQGIVGYDFLRIEPVAFCPVLGSHFGYGDLYVPIGSYTISSNDLEPLGRHFDLVFALDDTSMETACSRLADAAIRLRPIDKIIDAVIGMECLLLAGLRNEDRRGELKYRFSLHYATLFNSPDERYEAFRVAKDLYDHRSAFAHGGSPAADGKYRVGTERLSLHEVADRAIEALRRIVLHFLPNVRLAPYKQPRFWEQAFFGLPRPLASEV